MFLKEKYTLNLGKEATGPDRMAIPIPSPLLDPSTSKPAITPYALNGYGTLYVTYIPGIPRTESWHPNIPLHSPYFNHPAYVHKKTADNGYPSSKCNVIDNYTVNPIYASYYFEQYHNGSDSLVDYSNQEPLYDMGYPGSTSEGSRYFSRVPMYSVLRFQTLSGWVTIYTKYSPDRNEWHEGNYLPACQLVEKWDDGRENVFNPINYLTDEFTGDGYSAGEAIDPTYPLTKDIFSGTFSADDLKTVFTCSAVNHLDDIYNGLNNEIVLGTYHNGTMGFYFTNSRQEEYPEEVIIAYGNPCIPMKLYTNGIYYSKKADVFYTNANIYCRRAHPDLTRKASNYWASFYPNRSQWLWSFGYSVVLNIEKTTELLKSKTGHFYDISKSENVEI